MTRDTGRYTQRLGRLTALMGVLLITPSLAAAKKAVVPPLVARSTSAETVLSMTTLVSSELEFMDVFDEVVQLPKRPSQLGSRCLTSSSCLNGIARSAGAQGLVGGSVSKVGSRYNVSMVYLSGGRIVRTVKASMSTDPIEVADELASLVREAVTGVNPAAKAAADRVPDFSGGGMAFIDDEEEEEEDSFLNAGPAVSRRIQTPVRRGDEDYGELDEYREEPSGYGGYGGGPDAAQLAAQQRLAAAEANRRAEEEARRRAAEDAQRRLAAEAQRRAAEEARRRAAMEAQRSAAQEAARRAAEEARRAAAEAARYDNFEEDGFDPDAISFGGDADDIEYEDINFGSASSLIEVEGGYEEDEPPRYIPPARSGEYYYDDLDEAPAQPRSRDNNKNKPGPLQRSRARGPASASNAGSIGLVGRVGFARFQFLSFLTYGAEASYQVQDKLALVAGMEAFSTRRILPAELVPEGQPAVQWNTVLPINLGLLYKPSSRDIRPYVGGGAQLIPGYVQTEQGAASAFGFRARGGVDFVLAENFGLNLNAAVGMWAGTEFYRVEEGLQNTALVPQISAGTLFLF